MLHVALLFQDISIMIIILALWYHNLHVLDDRHQLIYGNNCDNIVLSQKCVLNFTVGIVCNRRYFKVITVLCYPVRNSTLKCF